MNHKPTDWKSDRLKDLAEINLSSLPTSTDPDYEFDYLEISNVDYYGIVDPEAIERLRYEDAPSRARRRVFKGNTMISSVRPNLQAVAFLPNGQEHFVCSTGFNVVQPNEFKLSPKFAYYSLISEGTRQYFEASAKGVSYPAVDDKDFEALEVMLPPLFEQRRIAAYLDASCVMIDTAVAAKRRQLETLDALRKSMIQHTVTKGLNPAVRMKRTEVEWIPEMPEHWRVVRVKDVLEFFNTVRVPLSAAERGVMTEKTYDYYGASGVIDKVESYLFDGTYILIAEDGANLLARSKPLAFLATGKFWVNNHAHILKPRWGGDDTFFVTLLDSQDYSLFVTGAAQPKLTMENLGRFKLAVPRVAEQNDIAMFIQQRDAEFRLFYAQIEQQIVTLITYRKSLIHECVTGQRRITEVDLNQVKRYG
jgi:type I restriction enzyme S subunit